MAEILYFGSKFLFEIPAITKYFGQKSVIAETPKRKKVETTKPKLYLHTEMAKKLVLRLRDHASGRRGDFTQP